jgi:hypothetical protein
MSIKFSDIEYAFLFVSMTPLYTNHAILCKEAGKFYYASEYGDDEEIPEEIFEDDNCIEIPNKNDLNLGRNLVFEFIEQYLPSDFEQVRNIFRKKGAYGRYKDFFDKRGFLQKWYDFENSRQDETLREWCRENQISLIG